MIFKNIQFTCEMCAMDSNTLSVGKVFLLWNRMRAVKENSRSQFASYNECDTKEEF
jgi:hypothetical protein